ncbi:NUMOD4 motif-containing HNH endonuclease [Streptomyces sp. NPDC048212]|uniref:NUMOD4 motif-containing HNH endonuclease n=1 Tax=Streptomyces sp. NPDC048212 TaxID=3156658 RepID=UPI0033E49CCF
MTEWRPVPGLEGFYDVSSEGQVRTWILSARYKTFRDEPKQMKPRKRQDGYWFLRLKGKPWLLHHLVFEVFIGDRAEGLHVRHLDGNQDNNRSTNLVLGTPTENARDKRQHGTLPLGEKVHNAKLKADEVQEIRTLVGTTSNKELAKRYGVSPSLIRQIETRRIWRHI